MAGKTYKTGIIITGDAKGGVTAIRATDSELKKLNTSTKKQTGQMKSSFSSLKDSIFSIKGAFVGIGIAGFIGSMNALSSSVMSSVNIFDNLGKSARRLGLAAGELQEFRIVAEAAGVSAGTFDTAFQRFARRVGQARLGTGELVKTLGRLNIDLKDGEGNLKTNADLFTEFGNKIGQVSDKNIQLAMTMSGVDTEGVKLIEMFRMSQAETDKLKQKSKELGIVFDDSIIKKAEDAATNIGLLRTAQKQLSTQSDIAMVPLIEAWEELKVKTILARNALVNYLFSATETNEYTEAKKNVNELTFAFIRAKKAFKADPGDKNLSAFVQVRTDLNNAKRAYDDLMNGIKTTTEPVKTEIEGLATKFGDDGLSGGIKKSADEFKKLNSILNKFNDRDIQNDLFELNSRLDDGIISFAEYSHAMKAYGQHAEAATKSTKKLGDEVVKTKEEADPFREVWKNTIKDLDSGFRNMWEGFVSGSMNSLDFVKQAAQKWLAEMLHMMTTQKLVASFGLATTGGASSSAFGSGTTSGFSPSNMTSMYNAGTTFFDSMALAGASTALASAPAIAATSSFVGTSAAMTGAAYTGAIGAGGSFAAGAAATGAATGLGVTAAGVGAAAMAAIPYIGIAIAVLAAAGVFDSKSDTTPDMSIWTEGSKTSRITGQDVAPGETDIQFTAASRYGSIGVMTQHDFFKSQEDAASFYENLVAGLNQMDDAIFQAVDESTNAAIEAVMGRNWKTSIKFEENGSITQTMLDRYNRIFNEIDGRMNQVFDTMLSDGAELEEAVLRTSAVFTTLNNYVNNDLTTAFDNFIELQDIANETLYQSYNRNLGKIEEAGNVFDWSIGALEEMSGLISDNRAMELGLLSQIKTIGESIFIAGEGYEDKWKLSFASDQQTRDFYRDEAGDAYTSLLTETDPIIIKQLADEFYKNADLFWNTLSDDEKKDNYFDFERASNVVQGLSAENLTQTQKDIKDMADNIATAITNALQSPAETTRDAANTMNSAANTMAKAAKTPKRVTIDILQLQDELGV